MDVTEREERVVAGLGETVGNAPAVAQDLDRRVDPGDGDASAAFMSLRRLQGDSSRRTREGAQKRCALTQGESGRSPVE